ncbi:hypothetical protein [Sorangium sp. So ce1389]|uniref:hypothetical protein n=1 Tax=Sorangium sp. So ce1389 TaxID=3133336 RepID=UPI003F64621E
MSVHSSSCGVGIFAYCSGWVLVHTGTFVIDDSATRGGEMAGLLLLCGAPACLEAVHTAGWAHQEVSCESIFIIGHP